MKSRDTEIGRPTRLLFIYSHLTKQGGLPKIGKAIEKKEGQLVKLKKVS
jgi:hypothetical protein